MDVMNPHALKRPIRVVLFGGGPDLEIGVKRRTGGKLEGTIDNVLDRGSILRWIALVSLDEETTKPLEAYIEFSGEFELRGIPPGDYEVHFREKLPTEKGEARDLRSSSVPPRR